MIAPGTKPNKFILSKKYKEDLKNRQVKWGIPGLSEFTFKRTYARKNEYGTEDYADTVIRVIEGTFSILKTHAKQSHILWDEKRAQRLSQEMADRMFDFKWTPPGRGMWIMGTDFMWEKGGAALNNCAYISTENMGLNIEETLYPFHFMAEMSMFGVGVGFDTDGANKVAIKDITNKIYETFVVPDSREGWVEAISKTIQGFIDDEAPLINLDVSNVRPAGSPLKGFGGIASGPGPLVSGCAVISDILTKISKRDNKLISSVDITDIMNMIGKIIVSGGIRRTAQIAFSDYTDENFFSMKRWSLHPIETGSEPPIELLNVSEKDYNDYKNFYRIDEISEKYKNEWWSIKLGGWRWTSNNSVKAKVGMNYKPFAESIYENGEPGFNWLTVAQQYGRIKDGINNKDYRVKGANPCVEQSLESGELCCLVENYPSHCDDYWDFQRTLKFSYLYAKAVTLMATHSMRTNTIIARNRRIGTSMTGIVETINKIGRTEFFQNWCNNGYSYIESIDKKYSEWLGVPQSIKRTSIKPSGSVSLVAGVYGAGMHHPKMSSGYRLMRIQNNSEFYTPLKNAGYKIEPAFSDPINTSVIYFPWITPEGVKTEEEVNIWEQMKLAADLQYWWSDNQVSATIGFTTDETINNEIERVLEAFDGQLKGVSFLLKEGNVYKQMPFTKADRQEVIDYIASLRKIDYEIKNESTDANSKMFCDSDSCMI